MSLSYSDALSTAAILISLAALYQATAARTRDMRVRAELALAQLRKGLSEADDRIAEAARSSGVDLSAIRRPSSGAIQQKQEGLLALAANVSALRDRTDGLKVPRAPIFSNARIDAITIEVEAALHEWNSISAAIDAFTSRNKP